MCGEGWGWVCTGLERCSVLLPPSDTVEVLHQAPALFPPPGLIFPLWHPVVRCHLHPLHYLPKHGQTSHSLPWTLLGTTLQVGGEV